MTCLCSFCAPICWWEHNSGKCVKQKQSCIKVQASLQGQHLTGVSLRVAHPRAQGGPYLQPTHLEPLFEQHPTARPGWYRDKKIPISLQEQRLSGEKTYNKQLTLIPDKCFNPGRAKCSGVGEGIANNDFCLGMGIGGAGRYAVDRRETSRERALGVIFRGYLSFLRSFRLWEGL